MSTTNTPAPQPDPIRRTPPPHQYGYRIDRDGNMWRATGPGFVDLATSPAGFGWTPQQALKNFGCPQAPSQADRQVVWVLEFQASPCAPRTVATYAHKEALERAVADHVRVFHLHAPRWTDTGCTACDQHTLPVLRVTITHLHHEVE